MQRQHFYSFTVAVGVLLAACASMDKQQLAYVRSHPELPVDVQNAIVSGEIIVGMGPDEVRASLGEPQNIVRLTASGGAPVERWLYEKKLGQYTSVYEVKFVDGKAQELISDGYMRVRTGGAYSGAAVGK